MRRGPWPPRRAPRCACRRAVRAARVPNAPRRSRRESRKRARAATASGAASSVRRARSRRSRRGLPHSLESPRVGVARQVVQEPGCNRPFLATHALDQGTKLLGRAVGIGPAHEPLEHRGEPRTRAIPAAPPEHPVLAKHHQRHEEDDVSREQHEEDPAERSEDITDRELGHCLLLRPRVPSVGAKHHPAARAPSGRGEGVLAPDDPSGGRPSGSVRQSRPARRRRRAATPAPPRPLLRGPCAGCGRPAPPRPSAAWTAGGIPNGSLAPCTTRLGTETASSSGSRLCAGAAALRRGGSSGKARHSTATAPTASAVRQATRAPSDRPPTTSGKPASSCSRSRSTTAVHAVSSWRAGAVNAVPRRDTAARRARP